MEPRDRAPQALNTEVPLRDGARTRVRLIAACLLVVGLALIQDPGFLVPDTKFDLVEAPGEFLARALHLWDAHGAFGQLQNQAYGYLWPMGPFFAGGVLAGLPGWLVQRLWVGLVMAVALAGTAKVSRALGVRSDLACLTAGFAFALSPRMLTTLGPISVEAWPSALAPWVLLALVNGSRAGSPRRWAALAGLGVAMVGGVNAAATFAVIPLGVVWLLTRTPGPRRRSLMLWWPVFTLLGTLWWLVPLFVMGAYSPPFLDYIESTTVTTFPTDLFDTLRGTSNWVPYVDPGSRAGSDLLTTSYLILNSGIVLAAGVAGVVDRRTRERSFLTLSVLVGVLMVTAGHSGVVEGFFAGDVRAFLDGALAPLRNVHKFDVVLRLPLVLGLALVIDRALRPARVDDSDGPTGHRPPGEMANRYAVVGMVLIAVAGASLPVVTGRITPAGALVTVPDYWRDAADWLEANDTGGTALLAPGSGFADYQWGSPKDEPLQYFSRSPWAVRNVIPLTPAGSIRMLDEVERRIVQGDGSPGLAALLRRAGVGHVVVRNDLRLTDDVPLPVVVHQAMERSGLTRVASFGPEVGGGATLPGESGGRILVNGGWQASYPAVEVFDVPDGGQPTVAAGAPATVVGGPEDLSDLADLGLLGDGPAQLASDLGNGGSPTGAVVLTDGLRARERSFARIHDGYSSVTTPGDVRRTGSPARDYLIGDDRWETGAYLTGATSLGASSSLADSTTPGGSRRGDLPYAAVDGSNSTQWVSGLGADEQTWWQVGFDRERALTTVRLRGGVSAPANQVVRVVTAAGRTPTFGLGPDRVARVALPDGATDWLRIEDASGVLGRQVAVAEVGLDDVTVRRGLRTPVLPEGWSAPDAVALRADHDARTGCVEVSGDVRCVSDRVGSSEEPRTIRRAVTLPTSTTWIPELSVRPQGSTGLDDLVQRGQGTRVSVSSRAVGDTRAGAVAMVDGDLGTTWIADEQDIRPTISVRWLGERVIDSVDVALDRETAARLPTRVELSWPGGTREVDLEDGRARFSPIRTDQLAVRIESVDTTQDLGFDAQPRDVAIGIGELRFGDESSLPLGLSEDERVTSCGTGPDVVVNGTDFETYVEASPGALLRGSLVPAYLCRPGATSPRAARVDELGLLAGVNDIEVDSSAAFAPAAVVLRRADGLLAASASTATGETSAVGERGTATRRRLTLPASGEVLELRQNVNAGWVAEQDGRELSPVTLDGWKQGFLLEGRGHVDVTFAPDGAYRAGLLGGLVSLLALVGLAVLFTVRRRTGTGAPALGNRGLPAWTVAVALFGAGALVAGWVGIAAAAVVGGAMWLLRRGAGPFWESVEPWVLGAPCFVVAAWFSLQPWGDPSGWAGQDAWTTYVLLVTLVGVTAGSVTSGTRSGTRDFSRRAGRSTRR